VARRPFSSAAAGAIGRTPLASARFRAVIGMSLLIMIGFGLIIPALPLFAKQFEVGETAVGWVITAFAITRLIGDLFAGALIDKFGERPITALGALIVGVSSIAAGAAGSFTQLWVLRGVGGVGSALFLGGLLAYLVGTTAPEERGRAMGIFQGSFALGLLLGPLIGGVLIAVTSVNVPLYVYGATCLVSVPLILRALGPERVPAEALTQAPDLPSGEPPGPRAPAWSRLRPLLANPTYRAALTATMWGFLVVSAMQTLLPVLWRDVLGRSEGSVGLPFTASALAGLLVVWHAGSLSDRRGRKFALQPAVVVAGLALAALGLVTNATSVIVVMAVVGAASGYARPGPTAMIADVASAESRGVAVSGYRIAGDLGSLIGPVTAGAIAEHVSFSAAFFVIASVSALVLAMTLRAEETAPAARARAA